MAMCISMFDIIIYEKIKMPISMHTAYMLSQISDNRYRVCVMHQHD